MQEETISRNCVIPVVCVRTWEMRRVKHNCVTVVYLMTPFIWFLVWFVCFILFSFWFWFCFCFFFAN